MPTIERNILTTPKTLVWLFPIGQSGRVNQESPVRTFCLSGNNGKAATTERHINEGNETGADFQPAAWKRLSVDQHVFQLGQHRQPLCKQPFNLVPPLASIQPLNKDFGTVSSWFFERTAGFSGNGMNGGERNRRNNTAYGLG